MERQTEKEQLTRENKERKGPDSLPVTKIKGKNPNQPTKHPQSRRFGISHRYPAAAPRKGHRHLNKGVGIKQAGRHSDGGKGDARANLSLSLPRSCVDSSFLLR